MSGGGRVGDGDVEEKKLAVSSILHPFNFVSVRRGRQRKRALFAEFINEINESKSAET